MSDWHPQVVRLGKIGKHPNADSLDITTVLGRPVIMQSGTWAEGDLAAYIPVDTLVPRRSEFEFLFGDKVVTHVRVDAKKLRGIVSQGMIVPVPSAMPAHIPCECWIGTEVPCNCMDWPPLEEGDSVVTEMELLKYERQLPVQMGGVTLKDPGFMPKYDLEALRKYHEAFEVGERVIVTEKLHGANGRFCYKDGELHVGSRTQALQRGSSVWWAMAEKYDLEKVLSLFPGFVFYGEVYGGSVQDLKYGKTAPDLAFFDMFEIETGQFTSWPEAKMILKGLNLPVVPQLWSGPFNLDKLMALAEGPSTVLGADHMREGIVVRPVHERLTERGERVVLKMAGEGYLTRKQ